MKEYGNKGSGHISYLSSTVVEDLIFLMGKEVLREIFARYSISVDSTGKDMAQTLLEFLSKQSLNIMDCRSQSFDNAANISGKYKATKALIKVENPLAEHLPCFTYSLNLVGKSTANTWLDAVLFLALSKNFLYFSPIRLHDIKS